MMKKPRAAASLVISANDTLSGLTIYRTAAAGWTTVLAEALVIPSQEEAEALLPQVTRESATTAVDPYLVEVTHENGRLVPVRYRERIRLDGPTVPALTERPDLTHADAA